MPAAAPKSPVLLVCGEDEFAVKERARDVFQEWSRQAGGTDHDTVDAAAANSGEALKALAKLREALQTLPFFGGAKVVWLQNCNFLGDDRTSSSESVTETLAGVAQELKAFRWENVRLLVSAGKVDKRKSFYKTLEKIGGVEYFPGWSAESQDWVEQAEIFARRGLRALDKEISDEALALLANHVGSNARMLSSELEKLATYVGGRGQIEIADVEAITTRNKQAKAFALGDALGDRKLAAALACLDRELWEIRRDTKRNEIGLLYGLISKVRSMILAKELIARKWLKPENDYQRFRAQLSRIPADAMPEERQFNPLAMAPFVMFRAAGQSRNYTQTELIEAMDLLLECNHKLISRSLDNSMLLQQVLVRIVSLPAGEAEAAQRAAA